MNKDIILKWAVAMGINTDGSGQIPQVITQYESEKWKRTDADTNQFGRQISESVFEFVEGDYGPYKINVASKTLAEIEGIINGYGYTLYPNNTKSSLRYIFDLYGDDAWWIVAECIFESENY